MATAADPSSPCSPRVPGPPIPWSHVVLGGHGRASTAQLPEAVHTAPTFAAEQVAGPPREKRSGWCRPSNGLAEAGAVMGAVSWPALSEAAKAPARSSSHETISSLTNGSVPAPASSPASPDSPPPKANGGCGDSRSSGNRATWTRQKSRKRGGGCSLLCSTVEDGASTNGGSVPCEALEKTGNSRPSSTTKSTGRSSNWDHGRATGGLSLVSHPGSEHHKNHVGGRRVHRHGKFDGRPDRHDWNHHTFIAGGDVPAQQQHHRPRAVARPFFRPPPIGASHSVATPSSIRSFPSPMGYSDIPSPVFYVPPPPPPEGFGGIPFVAPPPMFLAPPDLQLRTLLLQQIDYYFSSENLCKDVYLRQKMDQDGWVPLSLIAGFNRVKNLTNDTQFILETVKTSNVVELQGDKIRRRDDWKNWPPLPTPDPSSTTPTSDALIARLTHMKMGEGNTSQNGFGNTAPRRSSSSELGAQTKRSDVILWNGTF